MSEQGREKRAKGNTTFVRGEVGGVLHPDETARRCNTDGRRETNQRWCEPRISPIYRTYEYGPCPAEEGDKSKLSQAARAMARKTITTTTAASCKKKLLCEISLTQETTAKPYAPFTIYCRSNKGPREEEDVGLVRSNGKIGRKKRFLTTAGQGNFSKHPDTLAASLESTVCCSNGAQNFRREEKYQGGDRSHSFKVCTRNKLSCDHRYPATSSRLPPPRAPGVEEARKERQRRKNMRPRGRKAASTHLI